MKRVTYEHIRKVDKLCKAFKKINIVNIPSEKKIRRQLATLKLDKNITYKCLKKQSGL